MAGPFCQAFWLCAQMTCAMARVRQRAIVDSPDETHSHSPETHVARNAMMLSKKRLSREGTRGGLSVESKQVLLLAAHTRFACSDKRCNGIHYIANNEHR